MAIITSSLATTRKTTRKGLRVKSGITEHATSDTASRDTLRGEQTAMVSLAGFDKPLRSRYETIFATNTTQSTVTSIQMELDYLDLDGRQLHKRTVTVACDIPPAQTRLLQFPSWDIQQSFRYKLSGNTKRASGVPFTVKCRIMAVTVTRTTYDNQ